MPVFCEFLVESLSGKPPKSSSSRSRNYESLDINQRVRYLKAINKSDEFIQGGAKDDLVFSLLLSSKQVNAVKTKSEYKARLIPSVNWSGSLTQRSTAVLVPGVRATQRRNLWC